MPPLILHRLAQMLRATGVACCIALAQAAAWSAPWLEKTSRLWSSLPATL